VDSNRTTGPHAAAMFDAALNDSNGSGGGSGFGRAGSGGMTRSGSGSGRSGGREDFGDEQPLAALFCVFDGHCGRLAAEQAAQLLPRELTDRIDPRQLLQVCAVCRPTHAFSLLGLGARYLVRVSAKCRPQESCGGTGG